MIILDRVLKIIVTENEWYCDYSDTKTFFDLNTCEIHLETGKIKIDAGLICIHGDPGENGKIQAYLDLKSIPYINSDFHSSSLSFDKYTCNFR